MPLDGTGVCELTQSDGGSASDDVTPEKLTVPGATFRYVELAVIRAIGRRLMMTGRVSSSVRPVLGSRTISRAVYRPAVA